MRLRDISIPMTVGTLTVVSLYRRASRHPMQALCRCVCGQEVEIPTSQLGVLRHPCPCTRPKRKQKPPKSKKRHKPLTTSRKRRRTKEQVRQAHVLNEAQSLWKRRTAMPCGFDDFPALLKYASSLFGSDDPEKHLFVDDPSLGIARFNLSWMWDWQRGAVARIVRIDASRSINAGPRCATLHVWKTPKQIAPCGPGGLRSAKSSGRHSSYTVAGAA